MKTSRPCSPLTDRDRWTNGRNELFCSPSRLMGMTSTRTLIAIAATLLTRTATAAPLTPLASNVAQLAPLNDDGEALGVVARMTNGTLEYWSYTSTGWQAYWGPSQMADSTGIAAQYDYMDGGYYVFQSTATGLYEARSLDDGHTWSGWCQLDNRTDLWGAPSVVYLGPGAGFRVFAEVADNFLDDSLYVWTIDPAGGFCQSHPSRMIGHTITAPIATSWGGTRVDVFAIDPTGLLEHFWSRRWQHVRFREQLLASPTRSWVCRRRPAPSTRSAGCRLTFQYPSSQCRPPSTAHSRS